MKALYIHVPFCDSICAYCDFCRVKSNDVLIDKWLKELSKEIASRLVINEYDTIYIGGGTPSSLKLDKLKSLLELIKPYQTNCIEYTFEVNPESLDEEKCRLMKEYGINRVSMGVQTTSSHLLKIINRKHTSSQVKKCIELLRSTGINNISCDCMYSLPSQSLIDLQDTLDFFISSDLPHISIYSLTIEPNSMFNKLGYQPLDEDTEADYYEFIVNYLQKHGYNQYEISNFSKENYESLHNLHYWHYDDFVGISLGASGKENHFRYDNTSNFEEYFSGVYIKNKIDLTMSDEIFEYIMMGLRLKKGLSKSSFKNRFGVSFDSQYLKVKNILIDKGLIIETDEMISCSEKGYPLLNDVLEYFIS